MQFINEIIEYRFLSNALFAALLSGVVCGIVGTYIVARRTVFLSGGITHASFGGIGLGYYFGFNPILGAAVFAVCSSVAVEWASMKGRIRNDSAIGIVWSLGMAIGIIFTFLTPGYAPNLMSYLFGNILTVTTANIVALSIFAALVIVLFSLAARPIIYAAFDSEFARSRGVKVGAMSIMMSVVVALAIVLTIRMVGIVMLISLLTLPVVIVNSLSKSYIKIMVWSSVTAVVGNIVGLYVSWKTDIPCSAATIFVLCIALVIVKLLPLCHSKKAKAAL